MRITLVLLCLPLAHSFSVAARIVLPREGKSRRTSTISANTEGEIAELRAQLETQAAVLTRQKAELAALQGATEGDAATAGAGSLRVVQPELASPAAQASQESAVAAADSFQASVVPAVPAAPAVPADVPVPEIQEPAAAAADAAASAMQAIQGPEAMQDLSRLLIGPPQPTALLDADQASPLVFALVLSVLPLVLSVAIAAWNAVMGQPIDPWSSKEGRAGFYTSSAAKGRSAKDILLGGLDNLKAAPLGWLFGEPSALYSTLPPGVASATGESARVGDGRAQQAGAGALSQQPTGLSTPSNGPPAPTPTDSSTASLSAAVPVSAPAETGTPMPKSGSGAGGSSSNRYEKRNAKKLKDKRKQRK